MVPNVDYRTGGCGHSNRFLIGCRSGGDCVETEMQAEYLRKKVIDLPPDEILTSIWWCDESEVGSFEELGQVGRSSLRTSIGALLGCFSFALGGFWLGGWARRSGGVNHVGLAAVSREAARPRPGLDDGPDLRRHPGNGGDPTALSRRVSDPDATQQNGTQAKVVGCVTALVCPSAICS